MANAAEAFVHAMHAGESPRWLTLLGSSGAGKTMLTEIIIKWAKRYQEPLRDPRFDPVTRVQYRRVGLLKWSRCCEWMVGGDYGWIPQVKNDWLVAIDDIGVEYERIRALSISKLYEIFEARRGKWTIITANKSVEEIGHMDARIASRLFRDNSEVIEVDVEDYNIRKFKQRKIKA